MCLSKEMILSHSSYKRERSKNPIDAIIGVFLRKKTLRYFMFKQI